MELTYNPEHLLRNYNRDELWFRDNRIARLVEYFLWEFSNLNAPQELISRINDAWINYYARLFSEVKAELMVGTGLGLLPLLAASHGRMVFACDRYPMLGQVTRKVIEHAHVKRSDLIHYIFKNIHDIQLKTDIPQKCDMLVFDDFDHTLLETGYVRLLEHLKATLLIPNAVIVPGEDTIYAMCVELCIDNTFFDLSPLSSYQWSMGTKRLTWKRRNIGYYPMPCLFFRYVFKNSWMLKKRSSNSE